MKYTKISRLWLSEERVKGVSFTYLILNMPYIVLKPLCYATVFF